LQGYHLLVNTTSDRHSLGIYEERKGEKGGRNFLGGEDIREAIMEEWVWFEYHYDLGKRKKKEGEDPRMPQFGQGEKKSR